MAHPDRDGGSLDAALALAGRGWYVFPVTERGKTPTVRWRDWSTTAADVIAAEWSGRSLNVGIDCGKSGLLVVDEDEPGGFARFTESIGQTAPATYTVATAKGSHFYFAADGSSHGNTAGRLAQFGCDVRGDGGYVLAAGSTHPSGAVYHVASDCSVAPLPGWLADALDGNSGPFTDPAQRFELPDVIKAGERDQVLFQYACQLRAQGTKVAAAARLVRAAHGRCEQPAGDRFTVAQALAKIDQAWGYDAGTTSTEPARPASGRTVRLTPAATIKPRPVRWTWHARIPLGEITMTPGRGGVGKSTFHAWLIGHLTRGTLPGAYLGMPRPCIIAASEDSWERTIVGRLIAADADTSLVFRAEVIVDGDLETSLTLPADCAAVEVEIRRVGAVLLSVDPLISTVAGRLDTHKDREVREALQPLAQLADRTGCTVLGNAHFGKSTGHDPLALMMGSVAFGNVARAVLGFAQDTDTEDGSCVISQVKNNLGRLDLPSLRYRIDETFIDTDEGVTSVGKLVMLGESDRSVHDILRDRGEGSERTERDEAKDLLRELLMNHQVPAKEVQAAAKDAAISWTTIRRAADDLGVHKIHPDIRGPCSGC